MQSKITITKGFKYQIYPTKEQQKELDHHCFIYNQAYNIVLDIQKQTYENNKDKEKEQRSYPKASEIDKKVKQALTKRDLPFKTVVTQQARINANKALQHAIKDKNRGYPKFKNSKTSKQSFNWNNQGYQIKDNPNPKFNLQQKHKYQKKTYSIKSQKNWWIILI